MMMSSRKKLRSKLEAKSLEVLKKVGVATLFGYETTHIGYVVPSVEREYTPDWSTKGTKFHLEVKGKLDFATRNKMLLVQKQHPDHTFAFVFGRASNKIYRGSPTTYGDWAEANGFLWCDIKDFEQALDKWRKQYEQPAKIQKQPRRKRIQEQVCSGA